MKVIGLYVAMVLGLLFLICVYYAAVGAAIVWLVVQLMSCTYTPGAIVFIVLVVWLIRKGMK